jgi:hypothetical protein
MILRTPTDNENTGCHSLDSSCRRRPASRGGRGMDTGLRRYDGTESRYRCADHRCTCIFEGGHESTKFGVIIFRTLRVLRELRGENSFPFGCGSAALSSLRLSQSDSPNTCQRCAGSATAACCPTLTSVSPASLASNVTPFTSTSKSAASPR